ncbi:MAG: DUF3179 domain-containing protein [Chloroflexi bacterium]|nr:DUF3179 domain-containing protein [Chloroflexota bacterium]
MFNRNLENFDVDRALLLEKPLRQRLDASETYSLVEMLENSVISPEDEAMVMVVEGQAFVFVTTQVIHHGVIQGEFKRQPWMIAMCKVCNGAAVFDPRVHGKIHHFATFGIYNSMSLIGDLETRTYWDHITGMALYGVLEGYVLDTLTSLLHTTMGQAYEQYPDARLVLSFLSVAELQVADEDNAFRKNDNRVTPDSYLNTLGDEDHRLGRMDIGLGVWNEHAQCFYPIQALEAHNNVIADSFDGQTIIVCINPATDIPFAFFTDATAGEWIRRELHLNNGDVVKNGVLYDTHGKRKPVSMPLQLFQRWFGFSQTFPGCKIYGKE